MNESFKNQFKYLTFIFLMFVNVYVITIFLFTMSVYLISNPIVFIRIIIKYIF